MKPSPNCSKLIKGFEKCRLEAYKDPGSHNGLPITIGWGSTMRKDGSRFKLGDTITQAEADDLYEWNVDLKATVVTSLFPRTILTQNQFDALVSFVYNIGVAAFSSSSVYKKIKINPADPSIPFEFARWKYNDGEISPGLINRRKAETALYLKTAA